MLKKKFNLKTRFVGCFQGENRPKGTHGKGMILQSLQHLVSHPFEIVGIRKPQLQHLFRDDGPIGQPAKPRNVNLVEKRSAELLAVVEYGVISAPLDVRGNDIGPVFFVVITAIRNRLIALENLDCVCLFSFGHRFQDTECCRRHILFNIADERRAGMLTDPHSFFVRELGLPNRYP